MTEEYSDSIQNYSRAPTYMHMSKRKKNAQIGNLITNNGTDITSDNHLIKTDKLQPCGSLKLVEKQLCEGICAHTRSRALDQPVVLWKGLREGIRTTPYPISSYLTLAMVTSPYRAFLSSLQHGHIPENSDEALNIWHREKIMEEELKVLEINQTWEIVQLPPMKKPIGCRWAFTINYFSDGSIERYRGRLVAQVYTPMDRNDYGENFFQ